jgi:predicted negative regulator of RcsB-dependent stress response
MANNFDLEEQEQIDQLKHFWSNWGALISTALIVIFGAVAVWNGFQYWKNREALQAAYLLDVVETAGKIGDQARIEQAFTDIRSKYGETAQAGQAGLILAKLALDKNNIDAAKNALEWVAKNASDDGYKILAQLRLASIFIEAKSYDAALQEVSGKFPVELDSIVADRKGDIMLLQDKKAESIVDYKKSYDTASDNLEYRKLIEVKLNSLGVQPQLIANFIASGAVK